MAVFKVSTHLAMHPAALAAGDALGVWVVAGSWSARHNTDGRIATEVLPLLRADEHVAARLVKAGLWRRVRGGYQMVREVPAAPGCPPLKLWEIERTEHRRKIPIGVREQVLRRDGFACVECGSTEDLTLDHIHPWSRGGPDTTANLRVLCRPCNSSKGARI